MCGLQDLQILIGEWWRAHHVWAAGSPEPYRGAWRTHHVWAAGSPGPYRGMVEGTMCGLQDLQSLIGERWRTHHV